MSCTFDLEHYREILEAARAGGYRFARFGEGPEPGDLFLRHDIDLSLEAALAMAELEAELGVQATYLLMTESVFYNLASSEGAVAIARLRQLGHAVGLHAVYPNVTLDDRFDPVVSWHNPTPELMSEEIPGAINVYGMRYFSPRPIDRTRISTGEPAALTRSSARARSRGSRSSSIRRSGSIPERRWGRRCGRCSKPTARRRLAQLAADDIDLA